VVFALIFASLLAIFAQWLTSFTLLCYLGCVLYEIRPS